MIRRALLPDASRLSHLAERTFRDAFGAQNTSHDLDLHCRQSFSEAIQASEISSSDIVTFICEEGADLVGFAQIRLGAAPRCVEALKPGEVHRLYVVDECRGKGIAQSLMNACLDEFKRRDVDAVWLGVWERNPRAITFYRKFQFREAGEHVFQLGTDPQRDLIMVRQLTR